MQIHDQKCYYNYCSAEYLSFDEVYNRVYNRTYSAIQKVRSQQNGGMHSDVKKHSQVPCAHHVQIPMHKLSLSHSHCSSSLSLFDR